MGQGEVEDFFTDKGVRRALSSRRNRQVASQWNGEREAGARRGERLGTRLEISQADLSHAGDPQSNALFSEPVSEVVSHGPEEGRTYPFLKALARSHVNPAFVERPIGGWAPPGDPARKP